MNYLDDKNHFSLSQPSCLNVDFSKAFDCFSPVRLQSNPSSQKLSNCRGVGGQRWQPPIFLPHPQHPYCLTKSNFWICLTLFITKCALKSNHKPHHPICTKNGTRGKGTRELGIYKSIYLSIYLFIYLSIYIERMSVFLSSCNEQWLQRQRRPEKPGLR